MAWTAAIPYILQGASLLGGLFGRKKQKYIDPEYLRTHFGPEAIAKNAQELAQRIMASPYGQQLMASAAEQGQRLQTEMSARAAQSGLSPDTGGQSAASDFATSAAAGAQSGFERGVKSDIYQSSLPIAENLVNSFRQQYQQNIAAQNAEPSMWAKVGNVASKAAAMSAPMASAPGGQAASAEAAPSMLAIPKVMPVAGAIPAGGFQPVQTNTGFEMLPKAAASQNTVGGAVRRIAGR